MGGIGDERFIGGIGDDLIGGVGILPFNFALVGKGLLES